MLILSARSFKILHVVEGIEEMEDGGGGWLPILKGGLAGGLEMVERGIEGEWVGAIRQD